MQDGSEKAAAGSPNGEKSLLERFWLPVILALIGLATTGLSMFGPGKPGAALPPSPAHVPEESAPQLPTSAPPASPAVHPAPGPSSKFPVLARLASSLAGAESSVCTALLIELDLPSVGLRSIEYSTAKETGEWAHQCDLEESGYDNADELAAAINERLEERITSRPDGKERVWMWPLGVFRSESYLDLTARGKKPLELRVVVSDPQR